ncbi:MAG: uracil-DNA glycosylase [Betaproteobacteria bacterium]|nr:uracil-DNA glycosylase [Betaproteobacteria bacterium]
MSEHTTDCRNCLHFFITHAADFPYGCRAMNFKSRCLPAQEVEEASGFACLRFRPRVLKPNAIDQIARYDY